MQPGLDVTSIGMWRYNITSLDRSRIYQNEQARCRGVNTAVSIGEDTGFLDEAEGSLVVLSANKEARFTQVQAPGG